MFLVDNLWDIFCVSKEYRETGRSADLGIADDIYLNALKGNEDLKCVGADPEKLAQWEAEDQGKARDEYRSIVSNNIDRPDARRYVELTQAFTAGDREAFDRIKAEGAAAYHAYDEKDETAE